MNIKEFYGNLVMPEIKRELWNKDIIAYFSRTKINEREKRLRCSVIHGKLLSNLEYLLLLD